MARILVVDDAESDRLIEETILTNAGHEVVSTGGGEQALRSQLEEGVDLVITDLQMPDVHGFELISIFQDLVPSPPIIAVSGTGQVQLHMARRLGAVTTLEKPVDEERLLRAVEAALAEGSGTRGDRGEQ
jgi:DNA-binding NtrC family response regulator